MEKILEDDRHYYDFDNLAALAVSYRQNAHIGQLASRLYRSFFLSELLFKMVETYRPHRIIEIGNCLGINGLYLKSPRPDVPFWAINSSEILTQHCQNLFYEKGFQNAQFLTLPASDLRNTLDDLLTERTLIFFQTQHPDPDLLDVLPHLVATLKKDNCLIINNLYQKKEILKIWKNLKTKTNIRLSMDIFAAGILWNRAENYEKEDFQLIQHRYKPWSAGFW